MINEEAQQLLSLVSDQYGADAGRIHRLGNGELVVILKARAYHLWSFEDWAALRHKEKRKAKAARRKHHQLQQEEEEVHLHGVDYGEVYHVQLYG